MGRRSISSLRSKKKHSDAKITAGEDESVPDIVVSEDFNDISAQSKQEVEEHEEADKKKRKRVRKRKIAASSLTSPENPVQEDIASDVGDDRFNNTRTIYMEGLPFDATEASITSFFSKVGPLVGLRLPRWHDSGRLRGYGHVEFSTPEEANRAIKELNGAYMGKRYIKLDRPMTPRIIQQAKLSDGNGEKRSKLTRPAGCRTVFVKNLPYDCDESDVQDSFMVCGKIAKVRLASWNHTGKLKGFGYVDFKSEESAEIAVNKSVYGGGINVKGRPVICDFETGQAKASYKPHNAK